MTQSIHLILSHRRLAIAAVTLLIGAIIVGASVMARRPEAQHAASSSRPPAELVEIVAEKRNAVRLVGELAAARLGIQVEDVAAVAPPLSLRLPGRFAPDPNRLVRVRSRFAGEAVALGKIRERSGERELRYGDHVRKNQVMAVVWSKEVGEKKSELLDAASKLEADRAVLTRLETMAAGLVSQRSKDEAHCRVDADLIAVDRAERTLRTWHIAEPEITALYDELKSLHRAEAKNDRTARSWAEAEIRAPIDGLIVEKNFNVGDMVTVEDDLFKIADLTQLQVLVDAYEENLDAVRILPSAERRWTIDRPADSHRRIAGRFDLIGSVIDPSKHTGLLIGLIDNDGEMLGIGEFVTATIELPADPNLVAIPESALVEEGTSTSVFVEVDRERREFQLRAVSPVRRRLGMAHVVARSLPEYCGSISVGERIVVCGSADLAAELERARKTLCLK